MNCTATLDETFADFLLSRRAKGLAEKTLESYSSQWKAVARHLDTGTDIAALQKADLDAMIVSMRDAGLSQQYCVRHSPFSPSLLERQRGKAPPTDYVLSSEAFNFLIQAVDCVKYL